MTEKDARPFVTELKALGPGVLVDLFAYAKGSDKASCRSVAVEVAGDFAAQDSTLIPSLVENLAPLFRDRDLRGQVASILVGFGRTVTPHVIKVLWSEDSDERTMAFSVLFTVNRERITERKDLQAFEPEAATQQRDAFAKRWEEWWRAESGQ